MGGCDGESPDRVAPGVWGGVGLVVTVSATGAEAEFDCAIGQIEEPLALDRIGTFEILGTMTLGHGGPVREDEEPDIHPAVYRGRLDDDVLYVSVRIVDLGTTTETFALRKDNPGLLRRCL